MTRVDRIDRFSGYFPFPGDPSWRAAAVTAAGGGELASAVLERELAVLAASAGGVEGLAALAETTTTREGR